MDGNLQEPGRQEVPATAAGVSPSAVQTPLPSKLCLTVNEGLNTPEVIFTETLV